MRQSNLLIVNTGIMFGRMAITFGLSLLATRFLLRALGDVDFGLLVTVGAAGAFLSLFTSTLISSLQRHLAYEVGRNDEAVLAELFNTGLVLAIAGSLVVSLVGFGTMFPVIGAMGIPTDRLDSARTMYVTAVLVIAVNIGFTPFASYLAAHQVLWVEAVVAVFSVVSRLAVAYLLLTFDTDRLYAYAWLYLAVEVAGPFVVAVSCIWRFPASRPRPACFRKSQITRIGGFAAWSFLAQMAWRIRQQGSLFVLAVFFGPVTSAAYGLCSQVIGYMGSVAFTIQRAAEPAIVAAHAKGDRYQFASYAAILGKYPVILLSILFVPLWIEAPTVLALWLGTYPDWTVAFMRISIVWTVMEYLSRGLTLALHANGDVGWHARLTLWVNTATLGVVCAAIWCLSLQGPWVVPLAAVFGTATLLMLRVWLISPCVGIARGDWCRRVLVPVAAACLLPTLASLITRQVVGPISNFRTLVVFLSYLSVMGLTCWWTALESWERTLFGDVFARVLKRRA